LWSRGCDGERARRERRRVFEGCHREVDEGDHGAGEKKKDYLDGY
jgi:hypothetical protein